MKSCCLSTPRRSLVAVLSVCIITLACSPRGHVVASPLLVGTNHAEEKKAANAMTARDKFVATDHRTAGRVASGDNVAVSPDKLESDEARDLQTCTVACDARYIFYEDAVLSTCGTSDNIDSAEIGDHFAPEGDCYENSCCADDIADCCVVKPECLPCVEDFVYFTQTILSACGDADNVDSNRIYTFSGTNKTCYDNSCCADDVSECCIFAPSPNTAPAPSPPSSSSDCETCYKSFIYFSSRILETCQSADNIESSMIGDYLDIAGECYQNSCCADNITECCMDSSGPNPSPVLAPASPVLAPASPTSSSGDCVTCYEKYIYFSGTVLDGCSTSENVKASMVGDYIDAEGECHENSCCADNIGDCCVTAGNETCSEFCTAENVFDAADVLLECRSLDNIAYYMIDDFLTADGECIATSCCADEVSECCKDAPSPAVAPSPVVAPTSSTGSCNETCTANFIYLSNKMIEACGTADNVQIGIIGNYEAKDGVCYQDSCCADDVTECCINKPGPAPATAPVPAPVAGETPVGESIVSAPQLAPEPKAPTAKAKKTLQPSVLIISSANGGTRSANSIYYWLAGFAFLVIAY